MLATNNYSIQQVKLELGFYDKQGAHELQNKVSRLYDQQLHKTLNDFFDQWIPKSLLIRRDSLMVDLGSMHYDQLEKELPARLAKALEELFTPLFNEENKATAWHRQGFESLTPNDAALSLLEFYLLNGTFPWQANAGNLLTWKAIMDSSYSTECGTLGKLLQHLGQQVDVRKRIAYQSDQEDMEKVITAIIPAEAVTIITYQKKIKAVQQDQQIMKANDSDFNSAVSFFILTYLLKEQGSVFSQKMFIKSVLVQMAAHYNVTYFSVLNVFEQSLTVNSNQTGKSATLFNLLTELKLENDSVLKLESTSQINLSDLLQYDLHRGVIPGLYNVSAHKALQILKSAAIRQEPKERLIAQFSEELIWEILRTLPHWDRAIIAIQTSQARINAIDTHHKITQLAIKHLIMEAVWSSYAKELYDAFNEKYFYSLVASGLSVYGYPSFSVGPQPLADTLLFTDSNQLKSLPLLTKEHLKAGTGLTKAIHQQSLIHIMEYYLTWNRLPDNLPFLSGEELDNYLTAIILLLYQESPEALKRMMRSEKHAAVAHMHIHKLFFPGDKGGDYKKISLLLDEYIEKDALLYLKDMVGNGNIGKGEQLKPALDRLLKKAQRGETHTQLSLLLNSVPLTKYIALNYGEKTIQWLISSQTGDDETFRQSIESMKNLILNLITDRYERQRLNHLLNEATLFYLYLGQPKSISTYIHAVFRYLGGSAYTPTRLFSILLQKIQTDPYLGSANRSVISLIRHELKYQLDLQQQELAIKKLAEKREMEAEELKAREVAKKAMEKEIAIAQESEQQQSSKKVLRVLDKGDKLYIRNAGLILLHPFLSTYFTRLNLMEKGKFINLNLQARAVHLLQYLAYTTTSNPEHELVLNKILCNYPLHEPFPLEIVISQQEIDLSLEMIQVVIQRSGKLSSSSAEGFRASFLQREGAITATAEEWTLRVEQRGYDLILQTLPWSFGMVKFQWMDKPMITEWI